MSGHTRGPWRVMPEEHHRFYIRIRGTRLGERYKIANVVSLIYPENGSDTSKLVEQEAAQTRANACLIAAAPDLLEFAEEVRRTGDTRLASMAIAIISKATGGAA